jgi:hypothetical protein
MSRSINNHDFSAYAKRMNIVYIDVHGTDLPKMAQIGRDFAEFVFKEKVYPQVRGTSGPYGFSGCYSEEDAKKICEWSKTQGIDLEIKD